MKYLSPSRMSLIDQCGLAFKFSYIDKAPKNKESNTFYAAYGSLMHDIFERIGRREFFHPDQAKIYYNSKFADCNLPENLRPDYYTQGLTSIQNKFNELNSLEIIDVEVEFKISVDFSLPPLHGFIDLVYRDEKGRLIIRDYKTSKVYGKGELNKQYQQYVYSIACKQLFGEIPFKFEFDFVRFNETKEFIITDSFLQMGMIKVKGAWKRIKDKQFEANYSPFYCENFCQFNQICPMYMKKNGI